MLYQMLENISTVVFCFFTKRFAPSQAIFFIEFLYLKLTSSIAISFLCPTLSAFFISLSMQKSYFASFEKGLYVYQVSTISIGRISQRNSLQY